MQEIIYYNGLKYIYENKLNIKMIFLHIPYMKNIDIKYGSSHILGVRIQT